MIKSLSIFFLLFIFIIILIIILPRALELFNPINAKKIEWQELYELKELDPSYLAQGIEIYQDYLFHTVHCKDKKSFLIVFKFDQERNLKYLFTSSFPKIATHVSDLSIFNQKLYAIDYASNNLYIISIEKTLIQKKLVIEKTLSTNIRLSGSIIVTEINDDLVIFISQFGISKKIKVYSLASLVEKTKKPLFEIDAKYFIQGLYKNQEEIFISSNVNGIDPIFITNTKSLFQTCTLQKSKTRAVLGPGTMIEDIAVYKGYIVTSDEKTNKIYITKEKIE